AVKLLHESGGWRKDLIERLEREARIMASIRSPHVARVLDLLRSPDGRPCMVQDLLQGNDLGETMTKAKLTQAEAVRFARQICRGLSAAHDKGVVHRDLKPSNVFLSEEGGRAVVRILDFGVAKMPDTSQLTQDASFLGTPAYMAPEQAASASKVDARADVYSAGAILYHMLAGQPPYGEVDATKTLMRLLKEEPPRLRSVASNVPEALEAVVERAMARDPKMRFETAEAFHDALAPFADDAPPAAGKTVIELAKEARWLRPAALLRALAIGLVTAAWVAAMSGLITFTVVDVATMNPWLPYVIQGVAIFSLVLALGFAMRSVVGRWRSSPRLAIWSRAASRALAYGVGTLGVLKLGTESARALMMHPDPWIPAEGIAVMSVALVVAIVALGLTLGRD
ncbi:MAG: serine/threonine protein kinase, partial [Sandaracinaceae bacterium]|nr:serine/threonine protein kinase [Sandaracinaceae bacterium]